MNLKQLLFVQTVAKTSSFSRAAELCHASQPTLSNAIAQLEEELGGRLFVRTTRAVALTPFGEYQLPYIQAVLNDMQELEKAAQSYHNPEQQLIKIGLSPLIDMQLLTQALEPFRESHPETSIFFKECLLDDLQQRLQSEQIDFAILPEGIVEKPHHKHFFYQEPLYYIPQEHGSNTVNAPACRINELPDAQVIMTGGGCGLNGSLESLFQQMHTRLNPYPGQALSYKVIEEWASLGIGAGILPKAKLSHDNQKACPLLLNDGKPATFLYEWIWNEAMSSSQSKTDFINYIKTTIPAIIKGQNRIAVA